MTHSSVRVGVCVCVAVRAGCGIGVDYRDHKYQTPRIHTGDMTSFCVYVRVPRCGQGAAL